MPFDPRPLGYWDLVQQVSPVEHLSQFEPLMNAAELYPQQVFTYHMYGAYTQCTWSEQLCLPMGKSMTPDSCTLLAVSRLHLWPLRSHVRSPGSALMQSTKLLLGWCLTPFQASVEQSTFRTKKCWKGTGDGTINATSGTASKWNIHYGDSPCRTVAHSQAMH